MHGMEKQFRKVGVFFQEKDIHKFVWVKGVDGNKSLLDFVVELEGDRKRLLDITEFMGAGM